MAEPTPPGGASLSDAGRLLVEAARLEAAGLDHGVVGLEHLLLALLADGALAAEASRIRPMPDRDTLRRRLAGAPEPPRDPRSDLPLSPQARRLLEQADRDAASAGAGVPDRGAMLAKILQSPRGPLAKALEAATPAPPTPLRPAKPPPAPRERRERGPSRSRKEARRGEAASGAERPAGWERPARPLPPPRPTPRARPRVSVRALLLLAVPVSLVLSWQHAPAVAVFIAACVAVIPLAGYMGEATEHLAARTGPAVGGLLNATFGNAAELIIAIVALRAGLVDLVKASITGSILGNLLLILGLCLLAGGAGRHTVRFNRVSTGASAGMLALAVVGLVFPALFHRVHPEAGAATELWLSETVAVVLAVTYGFSLLFTLRTHRSLLSGDPHPTSATVWRPLLAVGVLAAATVGVAVESELLVHAVQDVTASLGLSEVFLGLIIIPVIGNAAEHAAAVVFARKGQMDLALQIALGSSTQVALLVAPLLVLVGVLVGQPMDLVFTPFEVLAVGLSTVVAAIITLDGETHWFEGLQLLAVYALVGATAFFL